MVNLGRPPLGVLISAIVILEFSLRLKFAYIGIMRVKVLRFLMLKLILAFGVVSLQANPAPRPSRLCQNYLQNISRSPIDLLGSHALEDIVIHPEREIRQRTWLEIQTYFESFLGPQEDFDLAFRDLLNSKFQSPLDQEQQWKLAVILMNRSLAMDFTAALRRLQNYYADSEVRAYWSLMAPWSGKSRAESLERQVRRKLSELDFALSPLVIEAMTRGRWRREDLNALREFVTLILKDYFKPMEKALASETSSLLESSQKLMDELNLFHHAELDFFELEDQQAIYDLNRSPALELKENMDLINSVVIKPSYWAEEKSRLLLRFQDWTEAQERFYQSKNALESFSRMLEPTNFSGRIR